MVVVGFAPAIIMGIAGWQDGVNVATLSGMAAFVACTTGKGWRTGLVMAGPFAVLAALAVWAAPHPWPAAIVLAIAAFLRGYAAKAGLHNSLTMAVIALGFMVAAPPAVNERIPTPVYVGLVALGTVLWATLAAFLLRKYVHTGALKPVESIRALAFSSVLALTVGVATWWVVDLDLGHTGGWIILTIVVVFQPELGAGFAKAVQRAAGTVAGFGIAVLIGVVIDHGPLLYLAGTVLLIAAMTMLMQGRPYWLFATLLTPAIVLLESGGSTVDAVAKERLIATLVGVAGTLVVMLALAPLAKHLQQAPARASASKA